MGFGTARGALSVSSGTPPEQDVTLVLLLRERESKAVNRFGFWLIGTSQLVPFC